MTEYPLVSIIIVNYNGKKLLEECFNSLSKVSYPAFEIILVDNNSSDDSIEFIKNHYPKTIIVKLERNYGFAYPNNVGTKNAKGNFLLFLNNDTVVTPNFLQELVNTLQSDQKIGICQSMLLKPNGEIDSSGDFIDSLGVSFSSKEQVKEKKDILSARGACMIVRRQVFEKLNGFDEKFHISFEDVDLGWRAWILGYKVMVIPQSVVYHYGGQTIQKRRSEIEFHGLKNQLSMKYTNFEPSHATKSILKFLFFYGIREIKIWYDYKTKEKTSITSTKHEKKIAEKHNLYTILRVIGWLIKNTSYLINKQKMIQKNRVMTTKQLIEKGLITP